MKKSIKRLITVFAVCAVSAFACMASGCSLTDKIKDKIEQARCEHEWNDGEVTKQATCMEKGELTKTCTLCDKVETEEIELAEHIAVYVQAVTPTCLEKGVTDGTVCSVCETKISGFQEILALGHIVVKDSAVKATCLEDGLTSGEHCSRCNEVLKAQEKVPATGHNLVILEAVEASCTTEGKTQGVSCDKCKDVFTAQEIIPALGHADENGDSLCDNCSKAFYEAMDYVEAPIVNLQTNAYTTDGVWYRVYLPEETEGPVMYYIQFVDNIGSNANGDNLNCIGIPSKNSLANGSYERAIYIGNNGARYVKVEGIKFYYAPNDEYVEFCLTMGDELTNEVENISFSLTKNTYVSKVWDSSSIKTDEKYQWEVYLLVAPSEE